ncbi:alpha-ketoglutarate-dependent sulfonate dioxygenase [Sporothrix brasiliensis 5110]|uniref:Alpha-ketoglutarate-dependent sulfonate dioxygenase n=1 Tax=Sporothrix brasiliensis 5110 TaxID=1398154 RepID=A0A0C2EK12_9PEZI|nr:alpha-ketoglutarate-dependent sulfonate dioxygenase [Sporothrix brasiliensis 5110]KIH86424.1 alpha-ketoglutarate-dependent sulfonate dioxygenase [Sporothrix brasiliensis 5110]
MSATATETRTEAVLTTQVEAGSTAAPAPVEAPVEAPAAQRKPLELTGALEQFQYEESTPVIGREFPSVNIVDDILNAKNADDLLKDLAITISQRGVVFFRKQDNLTNDLQKVLVQRLGEISQKPKESTLHIHPLLNSTSEFGVSDNEISTISSKAFKSYAEAQRDRDDRHGGAATWHSDIQFERFPADYTSLRLTELPKTGGDTLWASGYELYDRFSAAYQTFFEGLTANFVGDGFLKAAAARPDKFQLYEAARGNPANSGVDLEAVHPVVRTNPVTGWKSIFAIGNFPKRINELSAKESRELLDLFYKRIEENHDLQVRFKWRNQNDLAIWDNRSAFHSATNDYDGLGDRFGHRAVGIGEKPYLDPNSTTRTASLASKAQ